VRELLEVETTVRDGDGDGSEALEDAWIEDRS
jgi:hypothetical protein